MSFHLGKPILVMIVVAAISGTLIALRAGLGERPDLVVWVFADIHANAYRGEGNETGPTLIDQFTQKTGKTVRVDIIAFRAENVRLVQMFMSDMGGPEVPDLAEVEIGAMGKYFRPPLNEVGFLPLNEYLKRDGWDKRIVKSRLATWSKGDTIFGIPHDVHPVTLTYREDLFHEAGIDLPASSNPAGLTWEEFIQKCLAFQKYWRSKGVNNRFALELPQSNAQFLQILILQRHINVVDRFGKVHLNDPKVAHTLATYARMLAGDDRIASEASTGDAAYAQDFNSGAIACFFTPDWRVSSARRHAPSLAGKVKMMPLPIFEPGDARTATYGGTMLGIPKRCKDPEAAWKLAQHLYLSKEGVAALRKYTDILPPVMELWDDPHYHQPDPYYGGQKIGEMFVDLADEIPERHVTPATLIAEQTLAYLLSARAVPYAKEKGFNGLVEACQTWLDDGAKDLVKRIEQGSFE